ncbi:MAG: hypothetical protein DWQ04_12945 [Chloroflexi bacterium]|nr:MAG: hypothetical protein DWQ04_12945 [Chloroflexota bacterium]
MNKKVVPISTVILLAATYILIVLFPIYKQFRFFEVQSVAAQSEQASVSLETASFKTNEGSVDKFIEIDVIVTNTTPQTGTKTITVSYTTVNGTAIQGSDYEFITGTLVFDPFTATAKTKPISITIKGDTIEEPDEQFSLTLYDLKGSSVRFVSPQTTIIQINENDQPEETSTPVIFADSSEPNDTAGDASTTNLNDKICDLTLWPIGDVDYFQFNAKKNRSYKIFTTDLTSGLDTFIRVFDPALNQIASNDDSGTINEQASEVTILAEKNGFYYVEVTNVDPSDPTGKSYCIQVDEIEELTPTPTNTQDPEQDDCEFNSTFDTACLVGVGEEVALTFVPANGSEQDTDILKMWVLPGVLYTCETFDLSAVTDTNIILYNQDQQPFSPWIGNADRAVGDPSSKVEFLSTYKGWLYAMIGPENPPPYEEASLHTYSARCTAIIATSTPTPTATFIPSSGTGGGTVNTPVPTPTPFEFPTPVPTPTPIDLSVLTPVPPTPAVINIQPLPTSTAVSGSTQALTVNVTLYYDSNNNNLPEQIEGIMDAAVALYDNATGGLIAFGYTNEAGIAQFSNIEAGGAVRVDVPFLNYSQVVLASNSEILVRVAPQPLPIGIP